MPTPRDHAKDMQQVNQNSGLEAILYMIHHAYLPPQLPQGNDHSPHLDSELIDTVIQALRDFGAMDDADGDTDAVLRMVKSLKMIHDASGHIAQSALETALVAISNNELDAIVLHVSAQNAGIIIRKQVGAVVFEVFELSPDNKSVITTKGRLQRSFPACAMSVPMPTLAQRNFRVAFAQAVSQMSIEQVAEMKPKARKAEQDQDETRDTIMPHLVTELLTSFLRATGAPVGTLSVNKNTREEVLWHEAKFPWRRSPMWLLLRVTLQLAFARSAEEPSHSLYKPFMIYLLSRILRLAIAHAAVESDVIYVMNSKLSQRLLKLGNHKGQAWFDSVKEVMVTAQSQVAARWKAVMAECSPAKQLSSLSSEIDPVRDSIHELPLLDMHLDQLGDPSRLVTNAVFQPRGKFPEFAAEHLPCLDRLHLDSLDPSFALFAVETWVEQHLDAWLRLHVTEDDLSVAIKILIETYCAEATAAYEGNPEAISLMVLTVLDLWVACDKAACRQYNLLKRYNHEMDPDLLGSLLLPLNTHLLRASEIKSYLKRRTAGASGTSVSVFRDFGNCNSFAVRYFEQSHQHQELLLRIEEDARRGQAAKIQQLNGLNETYRRLMASYTSGSCEYVRTFEYDIEGKSFQVDTHSNRCKRCKLQHQANQLTISLHEWPLSRKAGKAKATVFELAVPPGFGAWRNATLFVLQTVLGYEHSSKTKAESDYTISKDPCINTFGRVNNERVGVKSQTKPSTVTHRNPIQIPATESVVCLANGLSYHYNDFSRNGLIKSIVITDELHRRCTFVLPVHAHSLQKFLMRAPHSPDGPEPNEVIADLVDCPDSMSLDEFRSFASLPLGCKIQWHNILNQLAMPSLDFTKLETALLILQVSSQLGPSSGDGAWESHAVLADETFCVSLLRQLGNAKGRIGENWESFHAVAAFICLAARLLALSPIDHIQDDCLRYLASCRSLLLGWTKKLQAKIEDCTDDGQRATFAARIAEIALVCMTSFAVDDQHLREGLHTARDASSFLRCSAIIQEHLPSIDRSHSSFTGVLLVRWRRLTYRAQKELHLSTSSILRRCLDTTVKHFWADYTPGSEWRRLPVPRQHWLSCSTSNNSGHDSFPVHFNLLTGELLVNAAPLTKLPSQYGDHPTYPVLFGRSHIQVMPSSRPGYRFSSRSDYAGHLLHFSLLGQDLLLLAVKDGCAYSLIPRRVLFGKLPEIFVRDHVHWFDHDLQVLLFAPINDPWARSSRCWRLSMQSGGWLAKRGAETLMSVGSQTARLIAGIFSSIEDGHFLHITHHDRSESVDIELPRIQLSFFLRLGTTVIRSRQFRGMFIDCTQNIGTLFGLISRLVLKSGHGLRRVLIPEGAVSFRRSSHHISVSVAQGESKCHSYLIDKQLGRLVGNGSMQSTLFLCHLHGLTSYCLPDPLTGLTGTEQALEILTSAAVRSFSSLDDDNLKVLRLIADISPKRAFYPPHLMEMQTVHWDPNLSFLSQHGSLHLAVQEIFSQAERSRPLYCNSRDPPLLDPTELHLLERDLIHSSTVRVSGFGAESFTNRHDACYKRRDRGQDSSRAERSFVVARSLFDRAPTLPDPALTQLRGHLWEQLRTQQAIPGPRAALRQTLMLYGSHLLEKSVQHLASDWCTAHTWLRQCTDRYAVMMWLATSAFAREADMLLIQTLVAFYCAPALAEIAPPRYEIFNVGKGSQPSGLAAFIMSRPIDVCPENDLPPLSRETAQKTRLRRQSAYSKKVEAAKSTFVQRLETRWPCSCPAKPTGSDIETYINVTSSMNRLSPSWTDWWRNFEFENYLGEIESKLKKLSYQALDTNLEKVRNTEIAARGGKRHVLDRDIFTSAAPQMLDRDVDDLVELVRVDDAQAHYSDSVERLIAALASRARRSHEQRYLTDLRESLAHLNDRSQQQSLVESGRAEVESTLQRHLAECKQWVLDVFTRLRGGSDAITDLHGSVQHAPRLSQRFFLRQLSRRGWLDLSEDWKRCIVMYGKAIRALQRAERLVRVRASPAELIAELLNVGDRGWDPMVGPDWLLLEVESGLIVREVQASIADRMLRPDANRNSVMQLNMGEGKSTVIVPIVAVTLADGQTLVRVFVARPQSKQMFQMLVSKLGGMLARRVYHMPVSRSLRLTASDAEAIMATHLECMNDGGILLVQPEHVLSLKLMAVESILNGDALLSRSLSKHLHFFNTKSRDIIDESDENFSVKFELIYTMGLQHPIELSPDRWMVIMHILGLVARFAPRIALDMDARAIEVEQRCGRFPKTRILRPDAGERLRLLIADHICGYGLAGFSITHQSAAMRQAILEYITRPVMELDVVRMIEGGESSVWNVSTRGPLLLIRGLLAGGVLEFVLSSKRWRVNYGIDPSRLPRTGLAVPFRAKDCPSARSEFSHPDVVILLTSLSYYYGGLTDLNLFDALQTISKADQAEVEYHAWVDTAPDLPQYFHHLSGINLKDRQQCVQELFPALRYSKGAIDYFLSHHVFSKHMRQFPHKISASGWDLGQSKLKPTTGFSGTIDSRHLLPLDVHHLELTPQKHTNALVLSHILQPENSIQVMRTEKCPSLRETSTPKADLLLQTVMAMDLPVRVILDVGAQILELNNHQVAEKWLSMWEDGQETEAAVYFNDGDELSVVDRQGRVEPLQISPYADRLEVCLIFLDEAHTRGTDLRLPTTYRAAVTLGPNLTKDRVVQACMRMRRLGRGQSLVFCIPDEIEAKIGDFNAVMGGSRIDVSGVLAWCISETLADHRRSMPLWAMQGRRFVEQKGVWQKAQSRDSITLSKEMAGQLLEPESQSLDYRYRPRDKYADRTDGDLKDHDIVRISDRCNDFDIAIMGTAALEEEQERELSPEVEEEREVERPAHAQAERHNLHEDLINLVTAGILADGSEAWLPAFHTLRDTSAAKRCNLAQFPNDLLATADFARTVRPVGAKFISDSFQRPVQWILTRKMNDVDMTMMIVSPFEAQALLPHIRNHKMVTLHVYSPRSSLEFAPLDSLDLFSEGGSPGPVPQVLKIQLNLFAGQLYFDEYDDYVSTCDVLGLAWRPQESGVEVASDGFILRNATALTQSPISCLRALLTNIRRDCKSVEKTHMGRILDGTLLESGDFGVNRNCKR